MYLLDFNSTVAGAFAHGFLKGLAAPVVLFHCEQAPAVPVATYLSAPTTPIELVLAQDWRRIGIDMDNVIARHGQAPTAEQIANAEANGSSR